MITQSSNNSSNRTAHPNKQDNQAMSTTNTTTKITHTTAACIVAVILSAISDFNPMPGVQAFQPVSLFMPQSTNNMWSTTRTTAAPNRATPCTVMRYQSPWDLAANSATRVQPSGGRVTKGWPGYTLGPMTLSLPGLLQNCPLQIEDPDVAETDTGYTLTFNLPKEVQENGVDISVSGRLLTVEVRVTSEEKPAGDAADTGAAGAAAGPRPGECVPSRSSRTHSAARSFVLPIGVAASDVTASWVSDGKVGVKLEKTPIGTTVVEEGARDKVSIGVAGGMEDAAGVPVHGTKKEASSSGSGADKIPSSATEYLSGLVSTAQTVDDDDVEASSGSTSSVSSSSPAESSSPGSNRSVLAALDEEFRDLAKAMWCDGSVRYPTEEQVAATVEAAREERARRVTAMKRATMATDVSEKDHSYVIK